jgi:hypothetical protein
MAIPEQIRKQSEAVAKLYEDLNPTDAADAASEDEGAQLQQADGAHASATESAPAEQGRPDTTKDEQTAEQRYRTLQGMYNADTARLRTENNQLGQRLAQMEQLLASLSAAPAPGAQQAPAQKLITDKDVEEYGDSIEVMRRAAREEVLSARAELDDLKRAFAQLQTNVVPKVEGVVQRQAANAEQMFWSELTAAVPNWRDINADQGFHGWLLEVDPLSGMARQQFLDSAQSQLDARRVAGFFQTWQSLNGGSTAQSPRSTAASQLEKQIAPGRGRTSASTTSANDGKTYTRAGVAKFFDDVRKGLYKGREQERDRIERDIFAAQGEGRIT